jgi:hypothetical protein
MNLRRLWTADTRFASSGELRLSIQSLPSMIAILSHRVLRFRRLAARLVVSALAVSAQAHSQTAPKTVSVSFGVDTTITNVGTVVRLVRAYLAKPDSSARSRGLWSTATDFDRRVGDLTTDAYQGFPATIIGVASDGPGDSVYVVRVLYATADSTGARISPLAMQRLYAVRKSGGPFGFKLAGALPRLTRDWERRSRGAGSVLVRTGTASQCFKDFSCRSFRRLGCGAFSCAIESR